MRWLVIHSWKVLSEKNLVIYVAHWSTLVTILLAVYPAHAQQSPRQKLLMDSIWKFHLGNEWGTSEGPINLGVSSVPARSVFNDASWPTVNLPDRGPSLSHLIETLQPIGNDRSAELAQLSANYGD